MALGTAPAPQPMRLRANAIEASDLSKRYRQAWALRQCSFEIPSGRIVALVGPNGAGKTTLLHLIMGLLTPTSGDARILGWSPRLDASRILPRVGFVAQDRPLYNDFTVSEMLEFGACLNPKWDRELAAGRVKHLDIPLRQRVGKLSGGQQSQVALTMVLAKRPEILLLDEPVTNLDPLARRGFTTALLNAASEDGMTVVFSSHVVAELERFCNFLVVLAAGRVQVQGDVSQLLKQHQAISAGPHQLGAWETDPSTVFISQGPGPWRAVMQGDRGRLPSNWSVEEPDLEELVLAYMSNPNAVYGARSASGSREERN